MIRFQAKEQKSNNASVSEEDIATLLQRYPADTVLTLLQEVANFAGTKIDWELLVKKSSTGISNAREYQMLWRHLAYRGALFDGLEDEAEPLDDDSDLEFDLEVTPSVNQETSAEVAACVKVLMTSGLPSELTITNNSSFEASLTQNVPNNQSSKGCLDGLQTPSGTAVSNYAQKQQLPTISCAGGVDGSMAQKKKRKPWSKAEDLELIAAVQKFGEGNWANILKGDYKGERTASQLSQRWTIIRKRQKNVDSGTMARSTHPSEAKLAATRHAMSLALLDMPGKNLTSGNSNKQAQNQSQPASMLSKPSLLSEPNMNVKSVVPIKRSLTKPETDLDSMGIKAAAMAAGARIVAPSDAASLMIAAQVKKAVHIIPSGGSPVVKHNIGAIPSVHHIRTGLSSPAPSSQATTTSNDMRSNLVKPASNMVRGSPATATQEAGANLVDSTKPHPEEEAKCDEERDVAHPVNPLKEQFQEDGALVSDNSASQQVEMISSPQTH
ncbi:hypothetical protein SAY86_019467 [Trapa natans]|uniref:Uncharacterized protein n=1 Tax=Trapa natans TaxID=22666 RepID=A0AAN7R6V5_TRANT|nr:hypothetical protein SAY86_019467 [Trapa natans]